MTRRSPRLYRVVGAAAVAVVVLLGGNVVAGTGALHAQPAPSVLGSATSAMTPSPPPLPEGSILTALTASDPLTAPAQSVPSTPTSGPTATHRPPALSGPYDPFRGPNRSSRVVLSFDDCPRSLGAFKATVRAAERLGIRLVLFPTGACIADGDFNVAYARSHGHYVFNHSVNHLELTRVSYATILRQLGRPGVVAPYGRPPFGSVNPKVERAYRAKHMRIWLWTLDTNDWRGKSRKKLVKYVIKRVHRGETVLMHMQWHGFNGKALAAIQRSLAKRHLTICRNDGKVAPVDPNPLRC